ncbi:MAG: hypothetical protein K0B11_15650 [Mariniphaga sp.]|nr:hypothetical protein [Mariniphaga sp.]
MVVKIKRKNSQLISRLLKELGGDVLSINDEQYEDLTLGRLMDEVKTNEDVDKDLVFKKLRNER